MKQEKRYKIKYRILIFYLLFCEHENKSSNNIKETKFRNFETDLKPSYVMLFIDGKILEYFLADRFLFTGKAATTTTLTTHFVRSVLATCLSVISNNNLK